MIWTAVIMKIRFALLLSLIFSVASVAPSFAAGERYALVIGNAKYPDAEAPLKEPINDARDIADELKRDGFNVDIGENLTGEEVITRNQGGSQDLGAPRTLWAGFRISM